METPFQPRSTYAKWTTYWCVRTFLYIIATIYNLILDPNSQEIDTTGSFLVETVLANVAKLRAGSNELQQLPCTIEVLEERLKIKFVQGNIDSWNGGI